MLINSFSRTDRSTLGRWWWTIDRLLLTSVLSLIILGIFLGFAASPVVAQKLGLDPFFFVRRHIIMVVPSLFIMLITSLLSHRQLRVLCWMMLGIAIMFLIVIPLVGTEIKGARRWINILGFSLQASEFVKPTFIVIAAWLFSKNSTEPFSSRKMCILIYAGLVGLILLQPDFGMVFVISIIWFLQFFLAGLSLKWVVSLFSLGISGVVSAYFLLPHVASRIDRFLSPDKGDQYQIMQSLQAFKNGGWLGRGPGEGIIKRHLPDSHSDFVFAVAGEEFGLILCLFIVSLYLFIMGRVLWRMNTIQNQFLRLAISGLVLQFGLQAIINMASSLHLIPTKGMTLPFLSYGGSSLLACSLGMGMLLGFTRQSPDTSHHNI